MSVKEVVAQLETQVWDANTCPQVLAYRRKSPGEVRKEVLSEKTDLPELSQATPRPPEESDPEYSSEEESDSYDEAENLAAASKDLANALANLPNEQHLHHHFHIAIEPCIMVGFVLVTVAVVTAQFAFHVWKKYT